MTDDRLERMGAFDAVMWGVEQDPLLRSVIVAMTVLDAEPQVDVLIDRITRMTIAVPKLRQRVIGNPVSLIPPRWEFDPNFDIAFHLKRFHVPADGTDRPLMRIAEQMAEQDFDRDRPLWQMALVQGWDGPRAAVIIKLHHAITDGVGGMAMAASLFDLTRTSAADAGDLPQAQTGAVLGLAGRVVNGVKFTTGAVKKQGSAIVEGLVGLTGRALADPGETAVAGAAFAQSAARLLAPANEPLSPLMHGRSLSVRVAVLQVPFRPLKAASKQVGATLNDTYLAAVAGGVAAYHEAHNAPADYLRINMPVNMRTAGSATAGNAWVPARFAMPVDSGDPQTRIKRLAPILAQARNEPALEVSDTVYRLLTALPQSAATSVSAGMMKGCDLAVTNLPGPPIGLFAAGARVDAIIPFAPKAGAAANIALMTYDGTAYIGINIDTRAIPDSDAFISYLVAGFDDVLAIADPDAHTVVGVHSGTPLEEPTLVSTHAQARAAQAAPAKRAPAKRAPAKRSPAKRSPAKGSRAAAPAAAAKDPAAEAPAAKAQAESAAATEVAPPS